MYTIKNTATSVRTRTMRALAPGRMGSVQRICGGSIRLGRGDFTAISDNQLRTFYNELALMQSRGQIEVREGGLRGPLVDFTLTKPMTPPPDVKEKLNDQAESEDAAEEIQDSAGTAGEQEHDVEVDIELDSPAASEPSEPDKPIDRMNKSELIAYAAEVLGESEADLEVLTKKQIMEKLS